MEPNTRCFFHTFPRPKPGEDGKVTLERAVKILRFMMDTGLVLAPEIVNWEIAMPDGGMERLQVLQHRACFTELAVHELPKHAATFGPISLAFNIEQLRAVGLTPVIYVPQGTAYGSLSQIGSACVKMAWHTKAVLQRLQELKETSDPATAIARWGYPLAPNATFNLKNTDPSGSVVADYTVPATNIDALMKHIGYRNIPFDHSIGMLSVFLNIFYPTDNSHSGDLLGYYRQREWRLIGGELKFNGRPMARTLTQAEADRLVSIDHSFWTRELVIEGNSRTRLALAQVYDPVENWKFFDLVSNVFVPKSIENDARAIVGDKTIVMEQAAH